jgi:hypothetical protein
MAVRELQAISGPEGGAAAGGLSLRVRCQLRRHLPPSRNGPSQSAAPDERERGCTGDDQTTIATPPGSCP